MAGSEKPKFFIGSTGAAYPYVEALVGACARHPEYPLLPVPWRDLFKDPTQPRRSILQELILQAYECDFGVFFFTPADPTAELEGSASNPRYQVRDNVVFEAGLFFGSKGQNSTVLVVNRGDKKILKLPADLGDFVTDDFELGPPDDAERLNAKEFDRLAFFIAQRWSAHQFVLDPGASKVLRKRYDCYEAAIELVLKAQDRVATILSYPGEVINASDPKLLWNEEGTQEARLYAAIRDRAIRTGVKVYRWMNLGVPSIFAQAEDLLELLKQHRREKWLIIKDTYCEFIECIVADDYVLIVLPDAGSTVRELAEVGVGLMIHSKEVANHFLHWFEQHLPVPNGAPFLTSEALGKYYSRRKRPPWIPPSRPDKPKNPAPPGDNPE